MDIKKKYSNNTKDPKSREVVKKEQKSLINEKSGFCSFTVYLIDSWEGKNCFEQVTI